jgi:hypothetical protein
LKVYDLQIHGVSQEIYLGIGEFFVVLHKPDDLVIAFKDLPMFQIIGDRRSKKDFHFAKVSKWTITRLQGRGKNGQGISHVVFFSGNGFY